MDSGDDAYFDSAVYYPETFAFWTSSFLSCFSGYLCLHLSKGAVTYRNEFSTMRIDWYTTYQSCFTAGTDGLVVLLVVVIEHNRVVGTVNQPKFRARLTKLAYGPVCAFFHNCGLRHQIFVFSFFLLDHLDDSHVQNTEVGSVEHKMSTAA